MKIELTRPQLLVINMALAYYQAAFEGDTPFGLTEREAASQWRVAERARREIWRQAPMDKWVAEALSR